MSWQNRITGHGEVAPEELTPNPHNIRLHPLPQQQALRAVLEAVGWVTGIIVNRTTGHLLDGHLRLEQALEAGEQTVPVTYVALSEQEEATLLALFDEVAALAVTDRDALERLLGMVETDAPPLLAVLDHLAAEAGIGLDLSGDPDDLAALPPEEEAADVHARLGELQLHIPREVYEAWQETLYDAVGMDPEAITAEIRRRLGL